MAESKSAIAIAQVAKIGIWDPGHAKRIGIVIVNTNVDSRCVGQGPASQ